LRVAPAGRTSDQARQGRSTAAEERAKISYPGFRATVKIATVAAKHGSIGEFGFPETGVSLMNKMVLVTIAAMSLSMIAATPAPSQVANSPRYAQLTQYAQLKSPGAQSIEKLDMSAVPDLDRKKVRRVQAALRAKGFDPGPINGVVGAKTKVAVQKFQDRFGIKATGTIDNQTLFALGVVGDKSAAVEEEPRQRAEPKQPRSKAHRTPPKTPRRSTSSGARGGARWCANYVNGTTNCGFYTFQQCLAAVSGVGGSCQSE
jgi:hypothetical protein